MYNLRCSSIVAVSICIIIAIIKYFNRLYFNKEFKYIAQHNYVLVSGTQLEKRMGMLQIRSGIGTFITCLMSVACIRRTNCHTIAMMFVCTSVCLSVRLGWACIVIMRCILAQI